MKLNESSPQQHIAIIALAGSFIFLNVLQGAKASSKNDSKMADPIVTSSIDSATGQVVVRPTKFQNPKLSWYEWVFCRGMQRSSHCSFRFLHPFGSESENLGVNLPDAEPKQNHVVYYRGTINKNMAMSSSIESPEAVSPPAKLSE